ncbi:MAG TPA: DUF4255 domain-containing protein [Hymenobacter sp.]|jgi:hypothetical protein|uniref:DUF4255 domain-containing protein n=1 Tax=Hymenobacter sp. TaxID=1898978 RepID=UPI002ED93C51
MIDHALAFLRDELSSYLNELYRLPDKAVLAAPAQQGGAPMTDNVISIALVNIEPETALRNAPPERLNSEEFQLQSPALKLNLKVLFATHFTDYAESLKFLTATLSFFQGRGVFTPQNSPRLKSFDRLVVELEPTTYQEWSFLAGMFGTKHTPSAVYKVRMIIIQDGTVQKRPPVVRSVGTDLNR